MFRVYSIRAYWQFCRILNIVTIGESYFYFVQLHVLIDYDVINEIILYTGDDILLYYEVTYYTTFTATLYIRIQIHPDY